VVIRLQEYGKIPGKMKSEVIQATGDAIYETFSFTIQNNVQKAGLELVVNHVAI
jgi:hypothetical protein